MDNSVVAGWTDFFVAAAAAVGALAGLVFVALSINLARIIELPGISGRAAETVTLLSAALIASLVVLVPDLSVRRLGVLLLIIWIPAWMVPTIHQVRELAGRTYLRLSYAITRAGLHQSATLPLLAAALSLFGWFGGGLNWLALSVVLSLVAALINAWVLLVEILR